MRLIIVSFHRSDNWCKYIKSRLTCAESVAVVSDVRGDGDINIASAFYQAFANREECLKAASREFSAEEIIDITVRCRTLRDLSRDLAVRMIGAMVSAVNSLYESFRPTLILGPTIDRYVFDVMARIAERQSITFIEMTTSLVPRHVLLMRRGSMIPLRDPSTEEIENAVGTLGSLNWAPTYVDQAVVFSRSKFWKTVAYFHLRGHFMNLYRWLRGDPLNIHYLEALPWRSHRVRLKDYACTKIFDADWEQSLENTVAEKRVFLGLQVFPESSIDYWIQDTKLIRHESALPAMVEELAEAGYRIFIKDHPNQFGFRRTEQIECLKRKGSTVIVPSSVPAALLIARCMHTMTLTGTIGFQAALAGKKAIVTDPYYAVSEDDYIKIRSWDDINTLTTKMAQHQVEADLKVLQQRNVKPVVAASIPGDFYTCLGFDPTNQSCIRKIASLIESLNTYLPTVGDYCKR